MCEHGRRRSTCKECGGASICEHGRHRRQCKESWPPSQPVQGVRRGVDMRAWPPSQPVQGVRRVVDVRARPPTQRVQGVRRAVDVRARPPTRQVQGVRRQGGVRLVPLRTRDRCEVGVLVRRPRVSPVLVSVSSIGVDLQRGAKDAQYEPIGMALHARLTRTGVCTPRIAMSMIHNHAPGPRCTRPNPTAAHPAESSQACQAPHGPCRRILWDHRPHGPRRPRGPREPDGPRAPQPLW